MGIGSALSELRQTKVHHLLCLVTETRGSKGKVHPGSEHGSPLREQLRMKRYDLMIGEESKRRALVNTPTTNPSPRAIATAISGLRFIACVGIVCEVWEDQLAAWRNVPSMRALVS